MALTLTSAQAGSMNSVETSIEEAFGNGVVGTGLNPTIDPIASYNNDVVMGAGSNSRANAMRKVLKDSFKGALAALLSALNIYGPLPVTRFTGTVLLAKLTLAGSSGFLTITDGFVTVYTPPT